MSRAYISEQCIWSNFEDCPNGCENGACLEENQSCTSHYEYKCYGDDVNWYDSCGNKEDIITTCEYACLGGNCLHDHCFGFQFFSFAEQSPSVSSYSIKVKNGISEIKVTSISINWTYFENPIIYINGTAHSDWISVGKEFVISVEGNYLNEGLYEDVPVTIVYDIKDYISGNTDTATCDMKII